MPLHCSRSLRNALSCTLVAGALALLPPSADASTFVVGCTPSAGEIPTLKLSPVAVPPPELAKYGFKLATTLDGCVANTQQLNDWIPAKNGTADGASIVQAKLTLAATGFGNCGFGIPTALSGAYSPVGTLKLKWLDANGDTIKSAKPTSVFLRISPLVVGSGPGFSSIAEGTVTKGLGIGASVRVTFPIASLTDLNSAWAKCAIGGFVIPGLPLPDPEPLKELPLSGRPNVSIFFPDPR